VIYCIRKVIQAQKQINSAKAILTITTADYEHQLPDNASCDIEIEQTLSHCVITTGSIPFQTAKTAIYHHK
jgi:hypothetical protein